LSRRYKIITRKHLLVISAVLLTGFLVNEILTSQFTMKDMPASIESDLAAAARSEPTTWEDQVQPVLERRCIVCHGCYDAPCQLELSSPEGLQRGASTERIYDPSRVTPMQPTRLLIDAKNTAQWRSRDFHPVINESPQNDPEANLKNSVLYHSLLLKQQHPQPDAATFSDSFTLGPEHQQACSTLDTMDEFARKRPLWGMPYAMPNLQEQEYRTLVSWLAEGAPTPAPPTPSATVQPQIKHWEQFLNGTTNKQRLVNRYLYEHLFHAHIHFTGSPQREFYRLVRSRTPPGQAINEIPTVRPFDNPGSAPFYYRLLRYHPSIVAKNHIVYEFSARRMERYQELFLKPVYTVDTLPSYQPELAANPFKVFAALPATSRYRFLLDEARFFIEGFIKGPACRSQIALDVIEDQFWVMFFDPEQPVSNDDTHAISEMNNNLQLPADGGNNLDLLRTWTDYWQKQQRYMERKQAHFKTIGTHNIGHALNYIWDGDDKNPNAALTVFRHSDSGSVAYGLVGENPETTWVIDYPLFERIHYLLVAGFNVYGDRGHHISTRIHMDFLRMEGEDYFLAFLPVNQRKALRDSWYVDQHKSVEKLFAAPQEWLKTEAVNDQRSDDPQKALYKYLKIRLAGTTQQAQNLNRCSRADNCKNSLPVATKAQVDKTMNAIARLQGENLHTFPEVTFVRIRTDVPEQDLAYTLIRNKAYKNVTSFLADEHEQDRADIEQDTMSVVNWLEGSYPNFFLSVALSEIDDFGQHYANIRSPDDYAKLVEQYGVSRTDPTFWEQADWFQDKMRNSKPVRSGLFDLNRYQMH